MLQQPGPYPLVVSPPEGGYKVVNGEYASSVDSNGQWQAPEISTEHFRVDVDTIALLYGRHFVGKVSDTPASHTVQRSFMVVTCLCLIAEPCYIYRSNC